jgi:hypothetical protein
LEADLFAVVTGDVNASSRLAAADAQGLEDLLRRCFEETDRALPAAALAGFSAFRGDAWQFTVGAAPLAVRATLVFRCRLLVRSQERFGKRLHTAAALGFGRVDYMPDGHSAGGGGEAYERSGRRLDRLRKRVPGMGATGLGALDGYLDTLLGVLDALARQWTAHRAEAMTLAMRGFAQNEIARRWDPPVTQQAIHKHLATAGWPAVEPALAWVETTLSGCNAENNLERL